MKLVHSFRVKPVENYKFSGFSTAEKTARIVRFLSLPRLEKEK